MAPSDKVLSNGSWGFAQQATQIVSNFVLTIILVRVLTVEDFGLYSYALSMAAIGISIMTAGLSGLAVKKLLDPGASLPPLMSALLVTRELFAILGYFAIFALSLTSESRTAIIATLIATLVVFSRAADVPELWFMSRMETSKAASIRIAATSFALLVRVAVLIVTPSVTVLLSIYVLESVAVTMALMWRYSRQGTRVPGFGRPSWKKAKGLLSESAPLSLSGIASQVNLRIDVVILQALVGTASVGVYSAAARLSEITHFIPLVFMNALLPVLLGLRLEQTDSYEAMLQRAYDQAFWYGMGVMAIVATSGPILIYYLFGPEYTQAIPVLLIHLLSTPFVFMGAVLSKWLIAEGYLWNSVLRHSLGASINVILNLILIPRYGLEGVALASTISYIVAHYGACFCSRSTIPTARQMTKAALLPMRKLRY